jgi:hypothetical protein
MSGGFGRFRRGGCNAPCLDTLFVRRDQYSVLELEGSAFEGTRRIFRPIQTVGSGRHDYSSAGNKFSHVPLAPRSRYKASLNDVS